jgi:hypothetical protein
MFDVNDDAKGEYRRVEVLMGLAVVAVGRWRRRHGSSRKASFPQPLCPRWPSERAKVRAPTL